MIREEHIRAAHFVMESLLDEIHKTSGKYAITIAGESGSGKSEIAEALAEHLLGKGIKSVILQQDDYFVYPPKTNSEMRKKSIDQVGISEVRIDLLEQNVRDILDGKSEIEKRLLSGQLLLPVDKG